MFFARFAAVMIASFAGLGMVAAGGPGTCDPADPQICVYNGVNMPCGPYGVSRHSDDAPWLLFDDHGFG